MPPSGRIALTYVLGLLDLARAAGVATDGLLEELGVRDPDDPDGRLPLAAYLALWKQLERRAGDEALGLRMAREHRPGAFSVLDYAARNSPTLEDALRCVSRYSKILNSATEIQLQLEGDALRVIHRAPRENPRHASEWSVATWVVVGLQLTDEDWTPRSISFQHPAPAGTEAHQALFRAPLTFGAGANEMVLDRGVAGLRVAGADARLQDTLERHALRRLLAEVPEEEGEGSIVERARRLISQAFAGSGDAGLERIAEKIGMSPRTLQRHLKREGYVSYQRLVDDTRRTLAIRYLQESPIAIREAAFLLGFSDPSAFYRAFKRWTGRTPRQFRDQGALA